MDLIVQKFFIFLVMLFSLQSAAATLWNSTCTSNSDCDAGVNMRCFSENCLCKIGYNADKYVNPPKCREGCDIYEPSYTYYSGEFLSISLSYITYRTGINVQDCLDFCTDNQCFIAGYNARWGGTTLCFLISEEAIQYGRWLDGFSFGGSYVRDCAEDKECPLGQHRRKFGTGDCEYCEAGSISNTTKATSCIPCPAGWNQPEKGQTQCIPCPSHQFSKQGSDKCSDCQAGTRPNAEQSGCDNCPAGTYSQGDGVCTKCPSGQISSEGSAECRHCDPGSEPSQDQSECEPCSPGFYSNASNCIRCPPGYFAEVAGQDQCNPCEAGKESNSDRTGCEACDPGFYSDEGSENCTTCPVGTYSGSGQSECIPCHGGKIPNADQSACTECPPGTFSNQGDGNCTHCSEGTVSKAGQASCEACPAGKEPNKNQSSCEVCQPGSFSDDGVECTECEPGSVQSLTGQPNCTACSAGTVPNANKTECVKCPAGEFSTAGSEACQPCPSGTYSLEGQGSCSQCDDGMVPSHNQDDCTTCKAGTHAVSGDSACRPCKKGTYSEDGFAQCLPCEAGFFPNHNKTGCNPCPPGTYSRSGDACCLPCRYGLYSPGGQPNCSTCDAGSIPNPSRSDCIPCPAGKYATLGSTRCKKCHMDAVSSAGSPRCRKCNRGYVASKNRTMCLENLAFNKPADQYDTTGNYHPWKAVDGRHVVHCSRTARRVDPWWRVELKAVARITGIAINNRHDCCGQQLKNLFVYVGETENDISQPCNKYAGPAWTGERIHIKCTKPIEGKYVTIVKHTHGKRRRLTICEAFVFGEIVSYDICNQRKPCKHGGTCKDKGTSDYECCCLAGWTGKNCEKPALKPKPPGPPKECLDDLEGDWNGVNYWGTQRNTTSFRACKRWDSIFPNDHELASEEDFCRNRLDGPEGRRGPWCYTTDPNKPWEYCSNIPKCSHPDEIMPGRPKKPECYKRSDKGQNYKGDIYYTAEGERCAKWKRAPHNYCRNPGGLRRKPFCWTGDGHIRDCDIDICGLPHPEPGDDNCIIDVKGAVCKHLLFLSGKCQYKHKVHEGCKFTVVAVGEGTYDIHFSYAVKRLQWYGGGYNRHASYTCATTFEVRGDGRLMITEPTCAWCFKRTWMNLVNDVNNNIVTCPAPPENA